MKAFYGVLMVKDKVVRYLSTYSVTTDGKGGEGIGIKQPSKT